MKRMIASAALAIAATAALTGGMARAETAAEFYKGRDRHHPHRLSAGRRLRRERAHAGAPHGPFHSGQSDARRLEHAGRGIAGRRQPHVQPGRAGRVDLHDLCVVRRARAAARQQVGAFRFGEVRLDRLHGAGSRLLRRLAGAGRSLHMEGSHGARDDLGRRRRGGDHVPASDDPQERAGRQQDEGRLRLSRDARRQPGDEPRRGERLVRPVRLLDHVAMAQGSGKRTAQARHPDGLPEEQAIRGHPERLRLRQERRGAADPRNTLPPAIAVAPVRAAAQRSGRSPEGAARGVHADDEGQGIPDRGREDRARYRPGDGRGDRGGAEAFRELPAGGAAQGGSRAWAARQGAGRALAPAARGFSERRVAAHGGALHAAALGIIIVRGVVLRRLVVPEDDGAGRPLEAELIFGHVHLLEEHLEDRVALVLVQAVDVQRELRIDVDALALRHRMRADHRMRAGWDKAPPCARSFFWSSSDLREQHAEVLEVVPRLQAVEHGAEGFAQARCRRPPCRTRACRRPVSA